MMDKLHKSANILKVALQGYLDVCSTVANYYESGGAFNMVSQSIVKNITTELEFIAACEININQAKTMVHRARNSCSAIVPIHGLPVEVMSYIFQLVLDVQPCCYEQKSQKMFLKSPEDLSHVCSRWRRIAIGSHRLWSRIDLVPFHSPSRTERLLARGEAFAARAGRLPLNIHIFGEKGREGACDAGVDLNSFCTSVSARIGALELAAGYLGCINPSTLENCLAYCVPGTLDKLVITGSFGTSDCSFIEAAEQPTDPTNGLLNIPKQRLEDLLLPVKVLRLSKLYFPWTSKAYHGLVDLELSSQSSQHKISISQLQLASILAASPGLRVLRFGLIRITGSNLDSPTVLNDLELLSFRSPDHAQHKILLQTISPGSNPLLMSIYLGREPATFPLPSSEEFARFMARSNVTQLYMQHIQPYGVLPWLPRLLRLAPGLTKLFITGFELPSDDQVHSLDCNASQVEINKLRPTGSRLDCLKLSDCYVTMNEFRRLTRIFPIQKLELEDCCVRGGTRADLDPLAEIFPVIEIFDSPNAYSSDYRAPWD